MLSSSDYFRRLQRHLALEPGAERELVRELADHVEDRVDSLIARGIDPGEARRRVLEGFGRPETFAHLIRQARLHARWQEAAIAALPAGAAAILLAFGIWRHPPVVAAFALAIVGGTLFGLWRGRPTWFYPWAGVALTFPFFVGYFAYLVVGSGIDEATRGTATPLDLAGLAGATMYFPLAAFVVVTALLIALQRDWLDASVLLTPLPPAIAWLAHMHDAGGVFDAGAAGDPFSTLIAFVYVGIGLATAAIIRAPTRRLRVGTLVVSSVMLLLAASFAHAQFDVVPLVARSIVLVAFLMSPALLAQRYSH